MYKFHLKNYRHVDEIQKEFRRLGIKHYIYEACTLWDTLKYGLGADNEWKQGYWGNRLVRQIDGLYGWQGGERYSGCSNKQKFRQIVDQYFPDINKNDVTVFVHDYTAECSTLNEQDRRKFLECKEGDMLNSYIEQHNRKPYGNPGKVRGEHRPNNFRTLFSFGHKIG